MAFQAMVDLSLGGVHGYEALVRGVDGESAFETLTRVDETVRYRFDQLCRTKAVRLAHSLGLDGQLSIRAC